MLLNGSSRSSLPDFERSFEAIFKHHYRPLLSYCRHLLGDRDEAEDVLQQTFIRAHRALRSDGAPRELRPWLYAIARNCSLSAIAARRPTAPICEETLDPGSRSLAGLTEEVHVREDLRELLAGIARLPEDQRSALLLAELGDLSHVEIASVVGCPVSKVKALVYQARGALIAEREARNASCAEIREQLSVARAGELRRGPLRRHLKLCLGCREFQVAVAAQRRSFAVLLPVAPGSGVAAALLGHGAIHTAGAGTSAVAGGTSAGGGAAAGAGGAAAATGSVAAGSGAGAVAGGGILTKLAVGGTVAVVAAGAGVVATHRPQSRPVRSSARQGVPRAADGYRPAEVVARLYRAYGSVPSTAGRAPVGDQGSTHVGRARTRAGARRLPTGGSRTDEQPVSSNVPQAASVVEAGSQPAGSATQPTSDRPAPGVSPRPARPKERAQRRRRVTAQRSASGPEHRNRLHLDSSRRSETSPRAGGRARRTRRTATASPDPGTSTSTSTARRHQNSGTRATRGRHEPERRSAEGQTTTPEQNGARKQKPKSASHSGADAPKYHTPSPASNGAANSPTCDPARRSYPQICTSIGNSEGNGRKHNASK